MQALKAAEKKSALVNGFADMDAIEASEVCKSVTRTRYGLEGREVLHAVTELRRQSSFDGLIYGTAIETSPELLDAMVVNHVIKNSQIFGNSSDTLRKCKNPELFFSILKQNLISYPEISLKPVDNTSDAWLVKHACSTGGLGVSTMQDASGLDENNYYQRMIDGLNFSLTFLANGEEIKSLGFNTQWSEALGENIPYAYSGAINTAELTEEQKTTAVNYATSIASTFNLIGLNSIDYILSGGELYVLEVNPRIPATYELYETRYGDLIQEHIDVCKKKKLDPNKKNHLLRAHAIVYAPETIQIPNDFAWPLWTADRPFPQDSIPQYEPICSVFSGGKNVAQVRQMIHTRKKTIIEKLLPSNE